VYAKQNWYAISRYDLENFQKETEYFLRHNGVDYIDGFLSKMYTEFYVGNGHLSFCSHCKKCSIWVNRQMVYPHLSTAPLPIVEMPESVRELYNEARFIASQSPRGACALLRLAIQLLIKELGENDSNLNKAIGNLVKKGLPETIQKALDSVRVVGNNAVHPGEIDIKDDPQIANSLFMLLNFISEKMITENNKVDAIYNSLPKKKLQAINERDNRG
ncbi:MAG: DUF4145 domain-containing protein, partial [Oligoflexia bacterium]|nr:DUF4145 domain-containing protein [Oligoflexia bacterium]